MGDLIPKSDEGDEEEGGFGLQSLFLNEEYDEFEFYFGPPLEDPNKEDGEKNAASSSSSAYEVNPALTTRMLAGKQCCTDWDLTGQIVWPAAFQLSYFIHNPTFTPLFKGKHVLELGSGAGLSGFVAANYASKVVLTDGNEIVMRLLHKNCAFVKKTAPSCCPVSAARLYWGDKDAVDKLVEEHGVPDILCGADIIMWPNFALTLCETLSFFFAHKPDMEAYVSYVLRATSTTRLLYECAEKCGLTVEVIEPDVFLPPEDWQPKGLTLVETKYMMKIGRKRLAPRDA